MRVKSLVAACALVATAWAGPATAQGFEQLFAPIAPPKAVDLGVKFRLFVNTLDKEFGLFHVPGLEGIDR